MTQSQTRPPTNINVIGTAGLSNPGIPVGTEAFSEEGYTPPSPIEDVDSATEGAYEVVDMDPRVSTVLGLLIEDLARDPNIVAIIAEPLENNEAVHITTFVHPMDEATRDATYDAELKVIARFPAMKFDFHLRRAETREGKAVIPEVPHALVVWHRPTP